MGRWSYVPPGTGQHYPGRKRNSCGFDYRFPRKPYDPPVRAPPPYDGPPPYYKTKAKDMGRSVVEVYSYWVSDARGRWRQLENLLLVVEDKFPWKWLEDEEPPARIYELKEEGPDTIENFLAGEVTLHKAHTAWIPPSIRDRSPPAPPEKRKRKEKPKDPSKKGCFWDKTPKFKRIIHDGNSVYIPPDPIDNQPDQKSKKSDENVPSRENQQQPNSEPNSQQPSRGRTRERLDRPGRKFPPSSERSLERMRSKLKEDTNRFLEKQKILKERWNKARERPRSNQPQPRPFIQTDHLSEEMKDRLKAVGAYPCPLSNSSPYKMGRQFNPYSNGYESSYESSPHKRNRSNAPGANPNLQQPHSRDKHPGDRNKDRFKSAGARPRSNQPQPRPFIQTDHLTEEMKDRLKAVGAYPCPLPNSSPYKMGRQFNSYSNGYESCYDSDSCRTKGFPGARPKSNHPHLIHNARGNHLNDRNKENWKSTGARPKSYQQHSSQYAMNGQSASSHSHYSRHQQMSQCKASEQPSSEQPHSSSDSPFVSVNLNVNDVKDFGASSTETIVENSTSEKYPVQNTNDYFTIEDENDYDSDATLVAANLNDQDSGAFSDSSTETVIEESKHNEYLIQDKSCSQQSRLSQNMDDTSTCTVTDHEELKRVNQLLKDEIVEMINTMMDYEKKLNEYKSENVELKAVNDELNEKIEKSESALKMLETTNRNLQLACDDYKVEVKSLLSKFRTLRDELLTKTADYQECFNSLSSMSDELQRVQTKNCQLEETVQTLEVDKLKYESMWKESDRTAKELEARLKHIEQDLQENWITKTAHNNSVKKMQDEIVSAEAQVVAIRMELEKTKVDCIQKHSIYSQNNTVGDEDFKENEVVASNIPTIDISEAPKKLLLSNSNELYLQPAYYEDSLDNEDDFESPNLDDSYETDYGAYSDTSVETVIENPNYKKCSFQEVIFSAETHAEELNLTQFKDEENDELQPSCYENIEDQISQQESSQHSDQMIFEESVNEQPEHDEESDDCSELDWLDDIDVDNVEIKTRDDALKYAYLFLNSFQLKDDNEFLPLNFDLSHIEEMPEWPFSDDEDDVINENKQEEDVPNLGVNVEDLKVPSESCEVTEVPNMNDGNIDAINEDIIELDNVPNMTSMDENEVEFENVVNSTAIEDDFNDLTYDYEQISCNDVQFTFGKPKLNKLQHKWHDDNYWIELASDHEEFVNELEYFKSFYHSMLENSTVSDEKVKMELNNEENKIEFKRNPYSQYILREETLLDLPPPDFEDIFIPSHFSFGDFAAVTDDKIKMELKNEENKVEIKRNDDSSQYILREDSLLDPPPKYEDIILPPRISFRETATAAADDKKDSIKEPKTLDKSGQFEKRADESVGENCFDFDASSGRGPGENVRIDEEIYCVLSCNELAHEFKRDLNDWSDKLIHNYRRKIKTEEHRKAIVGVFFEKAIEQPENVRKLAGIAKFIVTFFQMNSATERRHNYFINSFRARGEEENRNTFLTLTLPGEVSYQLRMIEETYEALDKCENQKDIRKVLSRVVEIEDKLRSAAKLTYWTDFEEYQFTRDVSQLKRILRKQKIAFKKLLKAYRKTGIAIVSFMGELFLQDLITSRIMTMCIMSIYKFNNIVYYVDEYNILRSIGLLRVVGPKIDFKEHSVFPHISYFRKILDPPTMLNYGPYLIAEEGLSDRLRTAIEDYLELVNNKDLYKLGAEPMKLFEVEEAWEKYEREREEARKLDYLDYTPIDLSLPSFKDLDYKPAQNYDSFDEDDNRDRPRNRNFYTLHFSDDSEESPVIPKRKRREMIGQQPKTRSKRENDNEGEWILVTNKKKKRQRGEAK